jgi:hypothetical protein
MKPEIDSLRQAVESLHGCRAQLRESVLIRETFEGATVWEGEVSIFDLDGHPTASTCYAWSHAVEGSDRRRFVAVLHEGPIDSPKAAVRAAIVQEYREKHGE